MPVNRTIAERIAAQAGRLEVKRIAMLRERDTLDRLILEAVTSRPDSAQWYAYPGELTIEEAVTFAGGGAAGVAAAVDREQKRRAQAAEQKAKPRNRRSSRKRAATRRVNTP